MYKVSFSQLVKDDKMESTTNYFLVADLERALAFASMLQKVSTPEVMFQEIEVKPVKLNQL